MALYHVFWVYAPQLSDSKVPPPLQKGIPRLFIQRSMARDCNVDVCSAHNCAALVSEPINTPLGGLKTMQRCRKVIHLSAYMLCAERVTVCVHLHQGAPQIPLTMSCEICWSKIGHSIISPWTQPEQAHWYRTYQTRPVRCLCVYFTFLKNDNSRTAHLGFYSFASFTLYLLLLRRRRSVLSLIMNEWISLRGCWTRLLECCQKDARREQKHARRVYTRQQQENAKSLLSDWKENWQVERGENPWV